jgi:hypothetical protein
MPHKISQVVGTGFFYEVICSATMGLLLRRTLHLKEYYWAIEERLTILNMPICSGLHGPCKQQGYSAIDAGKL